MGAGPAVCRFRHDGRHKYGLIPVFQVRVNGIEPVAGTAQLFKDHCAFAGIVRRNRESKLHCHAAAAAFRRCENSLGRYGFSIRVFDRASVRPVMETPLYGIFRAGFQVGITDQILYRDRSGRSARGISGLTVGRMGLQGRDPDLLLRILQVCMGGDLLRPRCDIFKGSERLSGQT